jgi:signal transduction histidine kinase
MASSDANGWNKNEKIPESGIMSTIKTKRDTLHLKPSLTCMNIHNRLCILLVLSGILLHSNSYSQESHPATCTDINSIKLLKSINKSVSTTYLDRESTLSSIFHSLTFSEGLIHKKTIPNEFVSKKGLMKFSICNHSDSVSGIYFFPGFYYSDIVLYKVRNNRVELLPRILPINRDSIGYRFISVEPHDSMTIIAELTFVKTYINTMRPKLISTEYLNPFVDDVHNSDNESDLMTYVFCGLLLMMILFSMANFLQGANPEFLAYSGYALLLGLMLFTKAMFTFHSTELSFFLEAYLDFIMQVFGIMCYMLFMQRYLATALEHPFLDKLYNAGIVMLVASSITYTFFHYFSDNFVIENLVENFTKVLLLLMTLIFLIYSVIHWQSKFMRYLFWGNLCLFVFSLFSQLIILDRTVVSYFPGIFRSALFYYELGLFLELVFFLIALNYKNRRQLISQARERERLKAENQMKEYEKELAVFKAQQQERERISADIHDELGSGMTAIRLMSEIARNKMKENTPVELDRISQSADEVLNKMNAIIWSMNSGNDTLDNLVSYIRAYALEYFENTPIECHVKTPDKIGDMELTGDKRRNIFLCIKETLNNALKHSKASTINIDFNINSELVISISDNGIGIDLKNIRQFGNGLNNIARRMQSIGGEYKIESNNGTITTLTLPL